MTAFRETYIKTIHCQITNTADLPTQLSTRSHHKWVTRARWYSRKLDTESPEKGQLLIGFADYCLIECRPDVARSRDFIFHFFIFPAPMIFFKDKIDYWDRALILNQSAN